MNFVDDCGIPDACDGDSVCGHDIRGADVCAQGLKLLNILEKRGKINYANNINMKKSR